MAKRLTATEKWTDPWFCGLSERDRLFWIYLLDSCNHAGIWLKNDMLIQVYFPQYHFNPDTFSGRLQKITEEKWFIRKFIDFQYGRLNPNSPTHKSVITVLARDRVRIGYAKGRPTPKDKDKANTLGVKKGSMRGNKFQPPTPQEAEDYARHLDFELDGEKFVAHYQKTGWKIKGQPVIDWQACVVTWKKNNRELTANGKPDWQ